MVASFFAYDAGFRGGVRVALGDVDGDGVDDLATAPGPGGAPHVKVFGGAQLLLGNVVEIASFLAFDASFTGGVFVAIGEFDATHPGKEVVVGAGEGGGPHVRVFRIGGGTGTQIAGPLGSFLGYDAGFRGGVRVAAANVTNAGHDDVVTGAGPGGASHVKVFNGADGSLVHEFVAYDPGFTGGVYVAAGRVAGGPPARVITGPGMGGGPEVRIFTVSAGSHSLFRSFFCYDSGFRGGVRVGFSRAFDEVVCAPGPGFVSLAIFNADPFPSAGEDMAGFDALGTLVFPNSTSGVFTSPN